MLGTNCTLVYLLPHALQSFFPSGSEGFCFFSLHPERVVVFLQRSALLPKTFALLKLAGSQRTVVVPTVRTAVRRPRSVQRFKLPPLVQGFAPSGRGGQAGDDSALCWSEGYIRFAERYYGCYGCRSASSDKAFCLYETDNDTAYVFYAIYTSIPDLQALLRTINAKRYVVTGSSGRLPFAESETCGMLRPLTDDPLPDDVFIGLTLN